MSKHTAGPWAVADLGEHDFVRIFAINDAEIAPARAYGDNAEQIKANAQLIAAAPELLELAKDGALQFDRLTGPGLLTYARTFAAIAREIIEKAEGRSI